MTTREAEILKALLEVTHDAEGGQFGEAQLHGAVNLRLQQAGSLAATFGEFNAALELAGRRGLLTAVINKVTGKRKWNINDAGEAARTELV